MQERRDGDTKHRREEKHLWDSKPRDDAHIMLNQFWVKTVNMIGPTPIGKVDFHFRLISVHL